LPEQQEGDITLFMKSIKDFAREIGLKPQVVNNTLIRRGVCVVEDFQNSDGLFSGDMYEDYIQTLNKYKEMIANIDFCDNTDSVPLSTLDSPVVYVLFEGFEIVYIGQSVRLFYRLSEHSQGKKFDHIQIINVNKDDLDIVEMLLILQYKPRYNISGDEYSLFIMVLKKIL